MASRISVRFWKSAHEDKIYTLFFGWKVYLYVNHRHLLKFYMIFGLLIPAQIVNKISKNEIRIYEAQILKCDYLR